MSNRLISFLRSVPLLALGLRLIVTAELFETRLLASEERDLVIVAGQSNAVGFDAYPELLPADPADGQVLFWFRVGDPPPDEHDSTSGGQWIGLGIQPKGHPISRETPAEQLPQGGQGRQYGNFKSAEGGFGPEIGFVRELRRREHNRSLAIVKVAFSGTGMRTDWNPSDLGQGGSCYRALLSEVKAARDAAKRQNIRLRSRALLWVQGESDSNARDAEAYERALGGMLARLREDLAEPQLPAFLAVNTHFGNDKNPFVARVVEAQKAIALKSGLGEYVDTEGAETLLPTQTHFTALGTLEVGRRFAEALLKWEAIRATK